MSVASRRAARKASGRRAQAARKKAGKSIKSSSAAKRARSRASERRRKAASAKAAAARRDAARPSVVKAKAASTAAARRDAARPSVQRAAAQKSAASAARSSRSGVQTRSTSDVATRRAQRKSSGQSALDKARAAARASSARLAAARRDAARPSVVRSRATSAAAARRDALRPSVVAARNANAAANQQAAQSMRSAGIRDLTGTPTRGLRPADIRRRPVPRPTTPSGPQRTSASTAAANQQAAQSLLGAGYRNVKGDKNKSTILQQIMSGFRNTLRGEGLPGDNPITAKPITTDGPSTRLPPPKPDIHGDPDRSPPVQPPVQPPMQPPMEPPITIPEYPGGGYPGGGYPGGGMMGGGFGYSPNLMRYESQQGAGQVPYYMAAARNSMNPNMSPAFMHAARNYDILGGMQRTRARPIEMMSARERAEIMNMGSNFNTPNYNSPYYQPSPQNQFDYFSNMVGGGGGKGAGRPMPQGMARAMSGGLGSFMGAMGGMGGMF